MSYNELTSRIKELETNLKLAQTPEETNYWGMELLVAEEILEKTISKGRR